ncbi:MAG: hypothetical protein WCK28_11975 [Burkholderiales bacterium]
MFNPWLIPLAGASASVIAMRTWMMVPVGGRHTAWQRREAARMVNEKVEAAREAQAEAWLLAWRLAFAPWTVWGPLAGRTLHEAMAAATESMVEPFGRRASTNVRRLRARVAPTPIGRSKRSGVPALPSPSMAAVIPITRARRRRRRRAG